MGFYLVVPGGCIYLILLCLVFAFPVTAALHGNLVTDDAIFYGFLFLVFYPVSMVLVLFGNKALRVFSQNWVIPLSLLPFIGALVLCFF